MRITPKISWLLAVIASVSIWSYTLVDPNLILLPWDWWFQFQRQLWIWGSHRESLAFAYWLLITTWLLLWWRLPRTQFPTWQAWLRWLVPVSLILLFGYNALSHDIFNYLFNAKMVLWLEANPHQQVAMDFSYDPWLRFMHNIHTPAPYGYGWTGWSLLPVSLSTGKFLLAYGFMRIWMAVGLLAWLGSIWLLLRHEKKHTDHFWLVVVNPLVLMETLLNGHNDVWMMAPVLFGIWLVLAKAKAWWSLPAALLLWAFSWNIKLASVLLGPVILGVWWWQRWGKDQKWHERWPVEQLVNRWPEWSALLMLVPLFTARSQFFHPWYLIWALSFIPLISWRWLRYVLLGLTVGSLWRYLPWIINDLQYSPEILMQMRLITWSGGFVGLLWGVLKEVTGRFLRVRK